MSKQNKRGQDTGIFDPMRDKISSGLSARELVALERQKRAKRAYEILFKDAQRRQIVEDVQDVDFSE